MTKRARVQEPHDLVYRSTTRAECTVNTNVFEQVQVCRPLHHRDRGLCSACFCQSSTKDVRLLVIRRSNKRVCLIDTFFLQDFRVDHIGVDDRDAIEFLSQLNCTVFVCNELTNRGADPTEFPAKPNALRGAAHHHDASPAAVLRVIKLGGQADALRFADDRHHITCLDLRIGLGHERPVRPLNARNQRCAGALEITQRHPHRLAGLAHHDTLHLNEPLGEVLDRQRTWASQCRCNCACCRKLRADQVVDPQMFGIAQPTIFIKARTVNPSDRSLTAHTLGHRSGQEVDLVVIRRGDDEVGSFDAGLDQDLGLRTIAKHRAHIHHLVDLSETRR